MANVSRPSPGSPIGVSPDGRYFVDSEGRPSFWLGDTQWELFRRYSPETALRILRDRQAKGFSVILVMLTGVDMAHIGGGPDAPYTNLEGQLPWLDGDPARPNERYFRHVDHVIGLGAETGQTLVVGVFHQWHRDIITVEKARAWARWVARRYRDVPNLMWSMYPRAEASYIPVCRELAAGLQAGDAGRHLISVHPDPSVASSSFIHAEPWLAFNMIQTCITYEQIPEAVTADYARTPVKPVVMAEGGYEGVEFDRLQTPHDIRKQAFWTQLAGGHHVYGHNDAWTSPLAYDHWLDAPGAQDLHTFRAIFEGLGAWWTLVPDPTLLVTGGTINALQAMAARAADGHWAIIYLSEPCTVTVRPDTPGTQNAAFWIHPSSGQKVPARGSATATGMAFTCPEGWEDAVLILKSPESGNAGVVTWG